MNKSLLLLHLMAVVLVAAATDVDGDVEHRMDDRMDFMGGIDDRTIRLKAKGEKGEKGEKSAPVKAAKPKKAFGVQNFQSAVLLGTFAALIGAAAGLVTSGGSFFTLNLGTVATGRRHQHRHDDGWKQTAAAWVLRLIDAYEAERATH